MKYLCMPDAFKGTLSSRCILQLMEQAILEADPEAEVLCIETADGGEGTLDAFTQAWSLEQRVMIVRDAFMQPCEARYGVHQDVMLIESAQTIGLHRVTRRDPAQSTSYGVGELILHGLDTGVKRIMVALGGSCSNDGGTGLAHALGVRFLDVHGEAFMPVGATLSEIERIELDTLDPRLAGIELIIMCDVDNPFYGPRGAARVFSAQKGADAAMIDRLDDGMRHLALKIEAAFSIDLQQVAGSGAAGGLGGMLRVLGGKLQPGIDILLDGIDFEHLVQTVDVIFTGEGSMDEQSLSGKVPIGIARRAAGKPVYALVGRLIGDEKQYLREGLQAVVPIHPEGMALEEALPRSQAHLKQAMHKLLARIKEQDHAV